MSREERAVRNSRTEGKRLDRVRGWRIPYILSVLLSSGGFVLAAILNGLVPQIAEDVTIREYAVGSLTVDMNWLYRLVLLVLAAYYLILGLFSAGDAKRNQKYRYRTAFRFAMGILLFFWDLFGTKLQLLPQPFFPGPAGILESFLMEWRFILENTLYSLRLFAVGFSLGVLFGVGTGILIGWFPKAYYWIAPLLNLCGVIPAVAWIPFALTLFPNPFSAAAFLLVICCWFPVASLTAQGIQSTPRAQLEAARVLGGNTWYVVVHVAIPHAMPQIFTGISTAMAFSFTTLVMAEMTGQPGGLGYYINMSKVWSAYYKVFAAILVMAVLFGLITKLLGFAEARVLRWQKGLVK